MSLAALDAEDTTGFAPRAAHAFDSAQPSNVDRLLVEVALSTDGKAFICGEATIHYVAQLHEQLKQLTLQVTDHVALDLSRLSSLDTAGAQALIAFKRSRPETSVHACPVPIRQFLELTGLTCLLTDEEP